MRFLLSDSPTPRHYMPACKLASALGLKTLFLQICICLVPVDLPAQRPIARGQRPSAVVPDVVRKRLAVAIAMLQRAHLTVGVVRAEDTAPDTIVVRQRPTAGAVVKIGDTVDLSIAVPGGLGSLSAVRVPRLIGLTPMEASRILENLRLTRGPLTEVVRPGAIGVIIAQDPAPGTTARPSAPVAVTVGKAPERVQVPDVVGQAPGMARITLQRQGLALGNVDSVRQAGGVGLIMWQQPPATVLVDPGTTVTARVSVAPALIPVPSVLGQSEQGAAALLGAQGLQLRAVTSQERADGTNEVIRQDPIAGTMVSQNSGVTITIAVRPVDVEVPDLVGQRRSDADAILGRSRLSLGAVTRVEMSDGNGQIIRQEPTAKTMVRPSGTVAIWVAVKPPPVIVPNLLGRTRDEAREILGHHGLGLGVMTPVERKDQTGRIVAQNPASGNSAIAGDAIDVSIAALPTAVADSQDEAGSRGTTSIPPQPGPRPPATRTKTLEPLAPTRPDAPAPARRGDPPADADVRPWESLNTTAAILIALLGLALATMYWKIRKSGSSSKRADPPLRPKFEAVTDIVGQQALSLDKKRLIEREVQLIPVSDTGHQDLILGRALIEREETIHGN